MSSGSIWFKKIFFRVSLLGLEKMFTLKAKFSAAFAARLKEQNCTVQIKLQDNSCGRFYIFKDGRLSSQNGIHPNPDIIIFFRDAAVAMQLLKPAVDPLIMVNAMKNFQVGLEGPDKLTIWFFENLNLLLRAGLKYGTQVGSGVQRYTSNTNGGPVFVYVKKGKIIRITPIEFDESDAEPWTIKARGKAFTPPRKTTVSPYVLAWKSLIYSQDRLLYPLKRVDFEPNGERNCQNRGVSGYERISWDQALDIVSNQIKRAKKEHGPGAIMNMSGSHHSWGNLGHWLSARTRFFNLIGSTAVANNPDSWEGWYWGAMHHWGQSLRLGAPESFGTVEDALKECELMVFWSSDPEATAGAYGAAEGTIRRLWLKELGIKTVHIDPYFNHTAALLGGKWLAPRPDTGNALALAIAYVWINEDLYDQEYVAKRTVGFEQWKAYILGQEDEIPKTPEWQEKESGVPGKDVRALAREWGRKKTYLAAGGMTGVGGAARCATGIEWARSMVCLMAMQGLGKPGVNMGGLQHGAPVDTSFFFPGYAEGGFSGDIEATALGVSMYQRMPQLITANPVVQKVPKMRIPEAIMEGQASGYAMDGKSIERQFMKVLYPAAGHSPVKMLYRYGASSFGTQGNANRYAKMYRSNNLEFVVNQSIWFEGDAKFADLILPACTAFERWDIGEFANSAGFTPNNYIQCNHRVAVMQHKCIEPLGESKSDFQIFLDIAKRLDLGSSYSEGMSEFEWCKRLFEATDLPKHISWKKFLEKGYYVVPAPKEELRPPVSFRWFAEDRPKDTPELAPLPAEYKEKFGRGLQTQSGKIEFVCASLERFDPHDPQRPVMSKFIPSWEGHHSGDLYHKYPLQLITPHPRFSFHTLNDAKDGFINDVKDHRVLVNGHYYWIIRINPRDGEARGIQENDLVKIFNGRGAIICAAQITQRIRPGTVRAHAASARYDPLGEPGSSLDRGGCVNLLTSHRTIIEKSHSAASNSCLVQIAKWNEEISLG